MKYSNEDVRRQDRLMSEADAIKLLTDGEYGVLSMQAEDGGGYGVPLNYVFDGQQSLYMHCAPEGRKLRCIEKNPSVTFCITGQTRLVPRMFTTEYNSTAKRRLAMGPAATLAARERKGCVLKARCRSASGTGASRSSSMRT